MKKLMLTLAITGLAITIVWVPLRAKQDQEEFGAIVRDWDLAQNAYLEAFRSVTTAQEARRVTAEKAPRPEQFAGRFLKFAEGEPNAPDALAGLCWAAVKAPNSEPGKRALALLDSGRLERVELGELVQALGKAQPLTPGPAPLAPLVLRTVKQRLDHPQALHLLKWVCASQAGIKSSQASSAFADAAQLIVTRFAASPDIAHFCECLGSVNGSRPWAAQFEHHLRTILEKNAHRCVKVAARFALASAIQAAGATRQGEAEKLYHSFIADLDGHAEDPVEETLLSRAKDELSRLKKLSGTL